MSIPEAPRVVYWNNIPSPYAVARLNAVAERGNLTLEAWFCARTEPNRSWAICEEEFRFPWRYLPGGPIDRFLTPVARLQRPHRPAVA